jgi:hypothetical protein
MSNTLIPANGSFSNNFLSTGPSVFNPLVCCHILQLRAGRAATELQPAARELADRAKTFGHKFIIVLLHFED